MSTVSVSMKLTPKQAGALYMKNIALEKEINELKAYLRDCIGIPASVGICEPIEGYAERPVDLKPAMRDMAKIVNELKAQVEQLRLAALNAISFMAGGEAKAQLRDTYDATPAQCLAEIKAQAGRDGFVAGALSMDAHGMANIVEHEADQYANKLRQQAKGGE